jgi:LCP family protein required for cell wall assembly
MEGQMNFLIAGKHGSLVDTMIFANINPAGHKVTLISIPRDLQYNNRKINSIYALYGMEELKRAISFVTGFQVDKYILIDMYAFIDVIDLIGGIDVHLDEPVIDPTYKTFDGGKWGTLYYRAGDYHLSGKQALRLARTRHTSSDFARSKRQHMILESIRDRAEELGLKDAGTIKDMATTILGKTETDVNVAEAIGYYFRYKDYDVDGGHVLTSANVLFSTYTGSQKIEEMGCDTAAPAPAVPVVADTLSGESASGAPAPAVTQDPCANIDKGAYILLPRNENWNAVRWYIRQILEGKMD